MCTTTTSTTTTQIPLTTTQIPITTTQNPLPTTRIPLTTKQIPLPTTQIPLPTTQIPITTTRIPLTTQIPFTITHTSLTAMSTTTEIPATTKAMTTAKEKLRLTTDSLTFISNMKSSKTFTTKRVTQETDIPALTSGKQSYTSVLKTTPTKYPNKSENKVKEGTKMFETTSKLINTRNTTTEIPLDNNCKII